MNPLLESENATTRLVPSIYIVLCAPLRTYMNHQTYTIFVIPWSHWEHTSFMGKRYQFHMHRR